MRCKDRDGNYRTATWRYFYASCPKVNQLCSGSGAYVAAVTVCWMNLW